MVFFHLHIVTLPHLHIGFVLSITHPLLYTCIKKAHGMNLQDLLLAALTLSTAIIGYFLKDLVKSLKDAINVINQLKADGLVFSEKLHSRETLCSERHHGINARLRDLENGMAEKK